MKLAILFWFYKNPRICKNRLQLLKKHNPHLSIFGLYGGDVKKAGWYEKRFKNYLDDFYASPFTDVRWKWINGDLMILDWYEKRGRGLEWDSVAVIQWDMLVFDSLEAQFAGLKKGQMFLSGLKALNKNTETRWWWTRPDREQRKNYLSFLKYIKSRYNFHQKAACCLFILQVFPRQFFEKFLTVKNRQVGMLEYKIPTYAKIFKIPFYKKDFGVSWFDKKSIRKNMPLNAQKTEVDKDFIQSELKKRKGFRIFHPYFQEWK